MFMAAEPTHKPSFRNVQRLVTGSCALVLATACSTVAYVPVESPRVAVQNSGFTTTFMKNGVSYGGGFLQEGLVEAVHGSPRAEEEATRARTLSVAGFVLDIAGVSALGTGVGLAVQRDPALRSAGAWVVLGGAVTLLAGTLLQASSTPHLYGAINLYNDSLEEASKQSSAEEPPLASNRPTPSPPPTPSPARF